MNAQTTTAPTTTESIETAIHMYCPFCNENPQAGQPIPTLCGELLVYGAHHYDARANDCTACSIEALLVQAQAGCSRCF